MGTGQSLPMKLLTTLVLVAAAMIARPACAAITISSITPSWSNVLPANVVGLSISNSSGSATVLWGTPQVSGGPQSSFVFVGSAPPPVSVVTPPALQVFDIGTFTFTNAPLANTPPYTPTTAPTASITGAKLSLSLTLSVDGGANVTLGPLEYVFKHEELPGDDVVTIDNFVSSPTFVIGSTQYTLYLSGFLVGNNQFARVLTAADGQPATAAVIRGYFDVAQITPPNPGVPEPLSIVMWSGLGLAAIGAARRRNKRSPSV